MDSSTLRRIADDYERAAKMFRELATVQDHLSNQLPNADRLSLPIASLDFCVRVRRCLARLGIETVGQLIEKTEQDLYDQKNFGVMGLAEVKERLAGLDLRLKPTNPVMP